MRSEKVKAMNFVKIVNKLELDIFDQLIWLMSSCSLFVNKETT